MWSLVQRGLILNCYSKAGGHLAVNARNYFGKVLSNLKPTVGNNAINAGGAGMLIGRHFFNKGTKAVIDPAAQEWIPIYRFRRIGLAMFVNRLKLYITFSAVALVPISYYVYKEGKTTYAKLTLIAKFSGFSAFTMCLFTFFIRRLVGVVSLDAKTRQIVRFGYGTFWGTRRNLEMPISSIVPFSELNFDIYDRFITVKFYDTKQYLYMPRVGADILDKNLFYDAFGADYLFKPRLRAED